MIKDKNKDISIIDEEGQVIKENFRTKRPIKESNFRYTEYLNLGFYLAAPILVGVFLGVYMDKWLNTKPVFVLVLLFLGTIASFYNLIKLTKNKDATH